MCGQCSKKNRTCQWEPAHSRFQGYRPATGSSSTTPAAVEDEAESMEVEDDDDVASSQSVASQGRRRNDRPASLAGLAPPSIAVTAGASTAGLQQSSASPFLPHVSPAASSSGGVTIPLHFSAQLPIRQPTVLNYDQAVLVHHYAEHLGRWLDATDPARQFTLRVPVEVKYCPILLHATLCFSARHRGDDGSAEEWYQQCIPLLIQRLDMGITSYDDNLLCAIVILRFFEQLNVPSSSGSDNEQHLAGSSAILRASQTRVVDPSAPTLREAAFWIYVRQCLYNSTTNQQAPNIDFSLRLEPDAASMHDSHPLAMLRLETAWANQMTWHCACVLNYCFDASDPVERAYKWQRWQELSTTVRLWKDKRPPSFDPIWFGEASGNSVLPDIRFTADWHGSILLR